MIGARRGAPLAVGHGEGEMFLGSDAIALAPFTNRITYLEDGDWVVLTRGSLRDLRRARPAGRAADRHFTQASSCSSTRAITAISWPRRLPSSRKSSATRSPNMSISPTARSCLPGICRSTSPASTVSPSPPAAPLIYAGLTRQILVRAICPPADRSRYRLGIPLSRGAAAARTALTLVISQSGETADTLAALRYCQGQGPDTSLAVVNVPDSTIARESDFVFRTYAGPEIGVASTKAFTCQLAVLACLAIAAARARGAIDAAQETACRRADRSPAPYGRDPGRRSAISPTWRGKSPMPATCSISAAASTYPDRARRRAEAQGDLLYSRRGLCGRRTQAWPDRADRRDMSRSSSSRRATTSIDKTVSNMEEVAARGGQIVLITDDAGPARRRQGPFERSTCRTPIPSSARCSMPCRCSSSPIMPRFSSAPMSTSRAIWRSR